MNPTIAAPPAGSQVQTSSAIRTRKAVIFDEHCPLCRKQVGMLRKLDWFKRLEFEPLGTVNLEALAPQVQREDLRAAMHVVTTAGAVHKGARAVRNIAASLPLLWPLWLLLWIPLVIYPAEWGYRRIARNRLVLSKVLGCEGGACELPPPKPKAKP